MFRLIVVLIFLLAALPALAVSTMAPKELEDLHFGEVLFQAFQEEWFEAIARLDTELGLFRGLDEPELDSLAAHADLAEFAVGDFELAYRMHRRAGRASTAVIEAEVAEEVRNEAIYRLARIYFQKDQPESAHQVIGRISGAVPAGIRDDLNFLRAQILLATGRFAEAASLLTELRGAKSLEGFAPYNLAIALLRDGREAAGAQVLDEAGRLDSGNPVTLAIRDKANLVLGDRLLEAGEVGAAKEVFDRVRLEGPFSNRALLGSGWADASRERFDQALVPWSLLAEREVTDGAVQEAMLAVPYAYGKLGVYSQAALRYGRALEAFGAEIDKLSASIRSIREGHFLRALTRAELKQDANWVVRLRSLPETPETFYLLELMASHDFQESLKNYLDLDALRRKLAVWHQDLDAFEGIIAHRRSYFEPLLPEIDREFRQLDSQMRLRLEQRDRIEERLQAMLVTPRPDYLATAEERVIRERLAALEGATAGADPAAATAARIGRLRGVLDYRLRVEYDRRLTAAHEHLHDLNLEIDLLNRQYTAFVRSRQAATQSFQGYDEEIRRQRLRIGQARERVEELMARQGHLLETMAVNELTRRRDRLDEFQVKTRFALADSYDRATRAQEQQRTAP